ncbi:hypothetical protein NM688_g72 [Phlebia brevispora]|uniref:Uncharacterized protein n=1 Tax=Phlebia brevispora TaxID=194682 RepID=A0ACC1TFP4_9APHY|nr:hypothetical protein NM688_g72 [Phlebia brevispora]
MGLSDYLVTDELTIILGLVAAGLFLLHNLYKPQSLVHPILLGRQSDVARVRNAGESAVYRNYSTGMMGRFPTRPTKDQQVLLDLVKPDLDTPRTLWSAKVTNPELRSRVAAFATGLISLVGLTTDDSNVLLLLNDEFVVSDLALASHSIPSFTLSSKSLLSPCLESHPPSAIITEAEFLPQLLELVYDIKEGSHYPIIVVGEPKIKVDDNMRVFKWEDIERRGAQLPEVPPTASDPKQVFSVSFYSTASGALRGAQLTHENITAGVAAVRTLLPPSGPISPLDTIASAHSLSTPFGRAVAYTAIFEGSNFATLASTKVLGSHEVPALNMFDLQSLKDYSVPSPTILFVRPSHLDALTKSILDEAKKSSLILFSLAWRHKLSGIMEGFTTKQSLWDRLVFDNARVVAMGEGAGTVRGVVVGGGPLDNHSLTPSRVALSIPLVNAFVHPVVSGPVFASHPLDLQIFPNEQTSSSASAAENYTFTYLAPVGPPAINVEAKLSGVNEETVEKGGDPTGSLLVRGPPVGVPLGEEGPGEDSWLDTEDKARVLPNGTFKVVTEVKN